jgi:SAM-dependent methyltransferase
VRTFRAPLAAAAIGGAHSPLADPALPSAREVWQEHCPEEVSFWDEWFSTKGLMWPDDYRDKTDPALPVDDFFRGLIDAIPGADITILDVGAGPLTILGKVHPGKRLRIVAVDPLADDYNALIDRHGVVPPVRTERCAAEDLAQRFAADSFDLVNATNCIDHSFDPVAAMHAMVRVLKPGRTLTMRHAENEADSHNYGGLHQWNLTIVGSDFWIRSKRGDCNVTAALSAVADVCCYRRAPNYVVVSIRKHDRR